MSDIDWTKEPRATHYNTDSTHPFERRFGENHQYISDGEWRDVCGKFKWTGAIPRPAQHRDWSDPAMWFDAPEWAKAVYLDNVDGLYNYCEKLEYCSLAQLVGESKVEKIMNPELGTIIATRPQPQEEGDGLEEFTKNLTEFAESVNEAMAPVADYQDNVNHPSHYTQGGIECIDAIASATTGKSGIEAVCVANVVKYLWRYEEKNGVEDVRKAQWYLNRLLSHLS